MRLSVYQRLAPSRDFHKPCVYTFCPVCQQLFEAELRRFSSNQSMKPTAPLRNKFSLFATTPCHGLSLFR